MFAAHMAAYFRGNGGMQSPTFTVAQSPLPTAADQQRVQADADRIANDVGNVADVLIGVVMIGFLWHFAKKLSSSGTTSQRSQ